MGEIDRFIPSGGLDKETTLENVKPGDWVDALNVRTITTDTESTEGAVPIRGNTLAYNVPAITAHNKTFRVYFVNNIATTARSITVQLANGNAFAIAAFVDGASIALTRVNYKAALTTALAGAGVPQTASYSDGSDTTGSYTDTTISSTGNYHDYKFFNTSTTPSLQLTIVVVAEAIPTSLSGELNCIGSFDLLGDLFQFWTPEENLPSTVPSVVGFGVISGATNPGTPSPIVITTYALHGLVTGQQVVITGVLGNTKANGKWIVNVITTTTFSLYNSLGDGGAFVTSPDAVINIYTESVGQIGVMTFDPNSGIYSYYALLTSKEFGFRTKKQIDSFAEKNNVQANLYWADDLNTPRVFYYSGAYMNDGGLIYANTNRLGKYEYGNIAAATKLDINTSGVDLSFTSQQQTGGAIKSGNWRYTLRLLTESLIGTDFLDLGGMINVFSSDTAKQPYVSVSSGYDISGDNSGVTTTKINTFSITNIPSNVFKFVELVAVNYSDLAEVAYTISRTLISPNQTSLTINHTGFETDTTTLDIGLINQRTVPYSTAKNIDGIDNRLILSNLATYQSLDFGAWTKTWTHSLRQALIPDVGDPYTSSSGVGIMSVNEFQQPVNVYSRMSLMANEVYRFGVKFKLKNGTITNVFWIDDVAITTASTNLAVDGTPITTPSRRTLGLADYNITSGSYDIIYTIDFEFNLDTTINGIPARDLIDEMIIEQVEMAESLKEIIATGVCVLGISINVSRSFATDEGNLSDYSPPAGAPPAYVGGVTYTEDGGTDKIGEYFFTTGDDVGNYPVYGPGTGPPPPSNTIYANAERAYLTFYSPDLMYSLNAISFLSTDKLINLGNGNRSHGNHSADGAIHYASAYAGYDGETNTVTPEIKTVGDYKYLTSGQDVTLNGKIYTKLLRQYIDTGGTQYVNYWVNRGSSVIYTTSNLNNVSPSRDDMGIYCCQYYKKRPYDPTNPDTSKFGDRNISKYISTQGKLKITSTSPGVVTAYGDVFNQKTFVKNRFAESSAIYGMSPDGLGWNGGLSFYSQNRVNTQMTNKHIPNTWEFPNSTFSQWMQTGAANADTPPVYNHGYDSRNLINADVAFDTNTLAQTDLPTRIIWSPIKPQDSLVDNYRTFLPLDFKDLDPTFGEIVHHANANGELVTWQQRDFMRQYFNARGQLQTNSSLNVIIGDGAVMNRNGQMLSGFGTKHKWSIIKGKSVQGNDVFYWINTELKKAIRFGYDGTISLADIRGMRSFLANNLTWVDQWDTPADGIGICGVWSDRYSEVIWTIRGRKYPVLGGWQSGASYLTGDVVYYKPVRCQTFEKTGELYVALQNNANQTPPNGGVISVYWSVIPHTNTNYYNEYTLVFNEVRNKFQSFFTFKPKIFLKWLDSYFSPRPISDTGNVYIMDMGSYCIWYDQSGVTQQEDGYIEPVVNKGEENVKWFSDFDVNSEIVPKRFDLTTKLHISYLNDTDFEVREGRSFAPVMSDTTISGDNLSDTSTPFGVWMKIKMTFEAGVYQKLISVITKFRTSDRMPNT